MRFIFVGLGGGLGAILRYAISCIPYNGTFPILTLVTNLTGAIFIGFIVTIAESISFSGNVMLFLKSGVCGGYTTFSTFSLEAYQLFQHGETKWALIYLILSVAGCLAGVWLGTVLAGTIKNI